MPMGYNTWPLMDGASPPGLMIDRLAQPVRERHDGAVQPPPSPMITLAAVAYAVAKDANSRAVSRPCFCKRCSVSGPCSWRVPLWLGLAHQGGALIALAAALWNLDSALTKSPDRDRR
jgi:hypothetical protein